MGSNKSISVIVMRDQGKTFSLRFSPNTFKVFLSAFIIIPILLILSVWFGLSTYQKYSSVLEETAQLRKKVEQNRQTVTRLANLERFLEKYSPNMLGLIVSNEKVDIDKLPVLESDKELLVSEVAKSLASEQMSFDIINNTETTEKNEPVQNAKEDKPVDVVAEKSTDTAIQEPEKKQESTESTENNVQEKLEVQKESEQKIENVEANALENESLAKSGVRQQIDLGYVGIENLSAKKIANTLYVNFRLTNLGKVTPIYGMHKYYISSILNGQVVWQEIAKATDTSFRIKKLKNVKSSAPLSGVQIGEKAQFVLDVVVKGQTVFRQHYPLIR